jgi:hypothetical protein
LFDTYPPRVAALVDIGGVLSNEWRVRVLVTALP